MREEPPTSPLFLEACLSTFGIPEDSASVSNPTEGRRETLLGNPGLQAGGTFQTAPFPRSRTRWQESEMATRGRPRPAESILLSPFSLVGLCATPFAAAPGSSVRGILQAGILEWVAVSFPRGSSRPRDRTRLSYISCLSRQILYHYPHLGNWAPFVENLEDCSMRGVVKDRCVQLIKVHVDHHRRVGKRYGAKIALTFGKN